MHPIVRTWEINQKMNSLLLGGINDAYLNDVSSAKGRTVGQSFAHIHNVRLLWLKASAPELMNGLDKIEKETPVTIKDLLAALNKSSVAISELIRTGLETGRIKGFKPHPEAFLGYMIAHEAHHRGQILLVLKENKHLPDKKILFGLWEWGNK